MKKRTGFVSNSSSSSFAIWGINDVDVYDMFDVENCYDFLREQLLQFNPSYTINSVDELNEILEDCWCEFLENVFEVYSEHDCIGWEPTCQAGDQTLDQFKQSLIDRMAKYFGKNTPDVSKVVFINSEE